MEGTHGHLRPRLANRLCRKDADRLGGIDPRAVILLQRQLRNLAELLRAQFESRRLFGQMPYDTLRQRRLRFRERLLQFLLSRDQLAKGGHQFLDALGLQTLFLGAARDFLDVVARKPLRQLERADAERVELAPRLFLFLQVGNHDSLGRRLGRLGQRLRGSLLDCLAEFLQPRHRDVSVLQLLVGGSGRLRGVVESAGEETLRGFLGETELGVDPLRVDALLLEAQPVA